MSSEINRSIQRKCCLGQEWHVLKPGGQLISISGPPDPAFA